MYKYNARSISEVYDLCSDEEWAELVYLSPTNYSRELNIALELYVKDSLQLQRRDRWEWFISFQDFLPEEEHELLSFFHAQNINPEVFMNAIRDILLCSDHKRNTLKLWGVPNSGKTFIARLLCKYFLCPFISNHGSEQPFFFENFLNKSILLIEELYVTTATVEDYKSILGGAAIDIDKKYHTKQMMQRTPIIITSNYQLFGRGHLTPIDEQALQTRCHVFHFNTVYKPKLTVTGPAFAHLFHWLYNKDMLT